MFSLNSQLFWQDFNASARNRAGLTWLISTGLLPAPWHKRRQKVRLALFTPTDPSFVQSTSNFNISLWTLPIGSSVGSWRLPRLQLLLYLPIGLNSFLTRFVICIWRKNQTETKTASRSITANMVTTEMKLSPHCIYTWKWHRYLSLKCHKCQYQFDIGSLWTYFHYWSDRKNALSLISKGIIVSKLVSPPVKCSYWAETSEWNRLLVFM